ncbi:AtpZ/AtpI family protein [Flavobacterium franklandianum]|uniref:AtpZ/AtpI family protein n=1 Tax=Flavobacterium franklandianum TaxID=2594430 RepID=A0A553CTC8_9FLAO|nr:AtpZ/AtpI family protein [Flavobacterium franklandianum]TRX23763.1 AtpZ/AtpI family protein [Flavobacterium franklandianum]TRX24532.1 AtpZ/AtpI family protein [Flavobacterium franklandianum]
MTDNQDPKKQTNNKWLALINIPIQMGAIIFLFSYFGNWLDEKYPNAHTIFVKILTLVGIAIAFYNINRQLKDINKSS